MHDSSGVANSFFFLVNLSLTFLNVNGAFILGSRSGHLSMGPIDRKFTIVLTHHYLPDGS